MPQNENTAIEAGSAAFGIVSAVAAAKAPLAMLEGRSQAARILFANDAFVELFGFGAAEPDGRPFSLLLSDSSSAEAALGGAAVVDAARAGGSFFAASFVAAAVIGPDGSEACWLCSASAAPADGAASSREAGEALAAAASAASALLREASAAARLQGSDDVQGDAAAVAEAALERSIGETQEARG